MSRIGCCWDFLKNQHSCQNYYKLLSFPQHGRKQFLVPSSSQIGSCNWLLLISKLLWTFLHGFEIALQIKIKGSVPWMDGLVSQVTTSSSKLPLLPSWKPLQGVDKTPEWMRGCKALPWASSYWSGLSGCTSRIQLSLLHIFMHFTHITAIENTNSDPGGWFHLAFPCKGLPLLLFQVAYDIRVCAYGGSTWRRSNEELDTFYTWHFFLLSTEELEGRWKGG